MALGWLAQILFAGIPAVTNLFGAKTQANAADRAAEIAAGSAREGYRNLREMYEQDRADFAPYLQTGTRMVNRAADLLEGYTPQAYNPVAIRDREGAGGYMTPRPTAAPTSMAALMPPRTSGPSMADLAQPGPVVSTTQPVPRPGGTVLLESPTGEQREVPAEVAEGFIRMGARRIR